MLVRVAKLAGDGPEREGARLVAHVAARGAHEIDDHRLAASYRPVGRALADVGVRAGADERRVGAARLGRRSAGCDRPVVDLAVEGTHPQDALMPLPPKPGLDLGRELDLGHAFAKSVGDTAPDSGEHPACLADALQLPAALDASQPADDRRAVGEQVRREPCRIVEVARGRENVELEPQRAFGQSPLRKRRRQLAKRDQRLDVLER